MVVKKESFKMGNNSSQARISIWELLQLSSCHLYTMVCRCLILVLITLAFSTVMLYMVPGFHWFQQRGFHWDPISTASNLQFSDRIEKFLEVPQIAWGLNNQKIAFARACLTARYLNRTLIMPSLSASLYYKEIDLLESISFDKVFQFERFNSLCNGFVRLGRASSVWNQTKPYELQKGSGRRWTQERDLTQLQKVREDPADKFEVIRIVGKNPFLWHDHWPITDYAKIFECLVLVDEIENDAREVIAKIREIGTAVGNRTDHRQKEISPPGLLDQHVPYVAVHMRIEKDWMIHCRNLEQRMKINQICSSKEEIMERVAAIAGLGRPTIVYLAVADSLLEDGSILTGWKEGLLPFEKKRLGVWDIYKKQPYLIQSAIDYEVCARADVFIGNSFSTFSSLIVLERTQKLIKLGASRSCGADVSFTSYAYNILGKLGGAQRWMTDMSASSLHSISYGTNNISC